MTAPASRPNPTSSAGASSCPSPTRCPSSRSPRLTCSCCSQPAPAAVQFWNQDRGYGICPRCARDWADRFGLADLTAAHGTPGVHFLLPTHDA